MSASGHFPLCSRREGQSIADFGVSSVERCDGVSPVYRSMKNATLFHFHYLNKFSISFSNEQTDQKLIENHCAT